ncbi:MAG: hypothetical protein OEY22_06235 [Candidatus Bathyarchaeota archaeon]|nr:hypothetical protein [Candidatus Bathyarchaeota archaeon]MDH5786913.1 hypothetical protein [Candidatus Bathyarchaeota archaeon]
MRKALILALTLALYVAMAIFMAGIVHAYFIDDSDYSNGTYTTAVSYVSGDYYSQKLHYPLLRSEGSGSPPGQLIIEYYWYAWPGGQWKHYTAYDDDYDGLIIEQQNYPGEPIQVCSETQAGYKNGGYQWDSGWATAAIPFTP